MARPRRFDQLHHLDIAPVCAEQIVHVDAVRAAQSKLPNALIIADISALFTALGDPTRLRIVAALATQELCVCDLAATLRMSQSAISHQLRILRELGLVRPRREGRMMYYALDDDHVSTLFSQAFDHVQHREEDHR